MTGTPQRRSERASEWQATAEVISVQRARGGQVLSITALCDVTGLKPSAVMSYVQRKGRGKRDVPMSHLARPEFRRGATPYWSQAQLDRYFEARAERSARRREVLAGLPEVTQEQADERGWWSLGRLSEWSGLAKVTLHRLATQEGFPAPVAVIPSKGPNPYVVRDRAAVEAWLRARRPSWKPVGE